MCLFAHLVGHLSVEVVDLLICRKFCIIHFVQFKIRAVIPKSPEIPSNELQMRGRGTLDQRSHDTIAVEASRCARFAVTESVAGVASARDVVLAQTAWSSIERAVWVLSAVVFGV